MSLPALANLLKYCEVPHYAIKLVETGNAGNRCTISFEKMFEPIVEA